MADDSITETIQVPWFSRIIGAFKGLVAGVVLIPLAGVLLFWNEGRSVTRYRELNQGRQETISLPGTNVVAANEGKLVHVSGPIFSDRLVFDSQFGVCAEALVLERVVEMYQWEEDTERKSKKWLGGGKSTTTTYTYQKGWHEDLISSRQFHQAQGHENPPQMPYESLTIKASPMMLGDFTLGEGLMASLHHFVPLPLISNNLPAGLANSVQFHGGALYQAPNPASPQIGDVRISFLAVAPGPYTVVAGQKGKRLEPFPLRSGHTLLLVEPGNLGAEAIFAMAERSNQKLTWILRVAGFVVMFLGLKLLAGPLEVVADVVPFVGNLLGNLSFVVCGVVAAAISLVIVSAAWIVYRPWLGAGLIAAALLIVIVVRQMKSATPKNLKLRLEEE